MGIHDGHRARKKQQFLQNGIDTFSEHEVLEVLLYYACPRGDTNPVAHRLLQRFGDLEAVFSAPVEELQRVEGIGENAATLIHYIVPLYRRIQLSSFSREKCISSTEAAGLFFVDRFEGEKQEIMYQLCIDGKGKLLSLQKVSCGNTDCVRTDIRDIVENALLVRANAVVLAHNHPSGLALPSKEDNAMTARVEQVLSSVGVKLYDHIIVADGDFVSLRENGLLH